MTEIISSSKNIEQKYIETEKKYVSINDKKVRNIFAYYRGIPKFITQSYLSNPSEDFSLRLRKTHWTETPSHVATLKTKGVQTNEGLQRIEINTDLSNELYEYYKKENLPYITKRRHTPIPGVDIDVMDIGAIHELHAESEDPEAWESFLQENNFENDFVEISGDTVNNEWLAHYYYKLTHQGREALPVKADLDPLNIVREISEQALHKPIFVAVGGRSGSGKTTFVNQIAGMLNKKGMTTNLISTDDYNHGNSHLYNVGGGSCENYDSDETYDLDQCRTHLGMLALNTSIPRRRFDFVSEEPTLSGEITPANVTFIEGIKAHHPQFRDFADLYYEIPTPLATCIGRRILRDLTERPRFSPEQNLAYYLKYTEPAYRAHL